MGHPQSTADDPLTEDGRQVYIQCKPGDISRYVLLPTDPFRNLLFKDIWDTFEEVAHYREFRTDRGTYKGVDLTVTSTGAGDLSTSVAVEQLLRCGGVDTLIRVGTTGALQEEIACGSMIINTGMIRGDGTTKCYIQPEYPALAHWEVTMALIEACERLGLTYYVGIGASADAFYAGQARPGYGGYWQSWWDNMLSDLQRAGVLNWEGEASTIFVLASLYGLRAGFVTTVVDNRITHEWDHIGEFEACQVGSEAVAILSEWDRLKEERGVRYVTPSLFAS